MVAIAPRRRRRAPTPRFVPAIYSVRNNPSRAVTFGAVMALAIVLTGVGVSDVSHIHRATVSGNQRLSAAEIFAASGLSGRSVFRGGRDAARRIEALPGVKHAEVRIALPARAWIAVVESEAVLRWSAPSIALGVDEQGRAISLPASTTGLVEVQDQTGILAAPGDQLPPGWVDAARAYGAQFGQLVYRTGEGFVASTPEGWTVRLGTDANLVGQQLATLVALRQRLSPATASVAFVDLRFANRPYYRLQSDGGRP